MKLICTLVLAAAITTIALSEPPTNQYIPPSNQYGAPSRPSNGYGAPAQTQALIRPNNQYGPPSNGYAPPSNQYGPPSNQYGPPSTQYGAPNGGYGSGRPEETTEPANYQFEYHVEDAPSGLDFGHEEQRQGDVAEGKYFVLLPDGRLQTVEYTADSEGYKPRISYEQVGGYPSGGPGNGNGGYQY